MYRRRYALLHELDKAMLRLGVMTLVRATAPATTRLAAMVSATEAPEFEYIFNPLRELSTQTMVIQLTQGELAILVQAAAGRLLGRVAAGASPDPDLALLLEMQLVTNAAGRLQITPMGQRVLQMVRDDPRRG